MALTKGETVSAAYAMIGMTNAGTTLVSEGVPHLERMMHTWWNEYIDTGYAFAATVSEALPADDSTLTNLDEDAVILNLAVKLATINALVIGGTLTGDAKTAKTGRYPLTPIPTAQNPYMPVGAGNQRRYSRVKYQGEGEAAPLLTIGGIPLVGG